MYKCYPSRIDAMTAQSVLQAVELETVVIGTTVHVQAYIDPQCQYILSLAGYKRKGVTAPLSNAVKERIASLIDDYQKAGFKARL